MWTKPRSLLRSFLLRLAVVTLVILFLLSLRLYWGWHAAHRIAAAYARLAETHVPTHTLELAARATVGPMDPSANLFAALDPFPESYTEARRLHLLRADYELRSASPEELRQIQEFMLAHEPQIACLDTLEKQFAAGQALDPKVPQFMAAYATRWTELRLALQSSVLAAIREHNYSNALSSCRRILILTRAIGQEYVLSYQNDARTISWTCRQLEEIAPQLTLNDPQQADQIRIIVSLLIDQPDTSGSLAASEYILAGSLERHGTPHTFGIWWILPLFDEDLASMMERYAADMRRARATTRSELLACPLPIQNAAWSNLEQFTRGTGSPATGLISGDVLFNAQIAARSTSFLLAAYLYAGQHGTFPNGLADLVPAFLPKTLADPWADGAPLHYRSDTDGPTVWSVGSDGSDNGGKIAVEMNGSTFSNDEVFGAENRKARALADKNRAQWLMDQKAIATKPQTQ